MLRLLSRMSLFQSTLLQEERLAPVQQQGITPQFQSTLLQEERHKARSSRLSRSRFQSTLLQEERQIHPAQKPVAVLFQSTLLQEERHDFGRTVETYNDFNPRSYKRSDNRRHHPIKSKQDFNPRSYKRSDDGGYKGAGETVISIHAPTRGATSEQIFQNCA